MRTTFKEGQKKFLLTDEHAFEKDRGGKEPAYFSFLYDDRLPELMR